MRRGPALFILICLLVASGYGAQRLLAESWARVTTFSPAYFEAQRPVAGPPPLAKRVVLIMIDGLHPDDAPLLPSLDWLHRNGSTYRLTVPEPGYPLPATATILTGAPPTIHGLLVGAQHQALRADSLPAAAASVHLGVGGVGSAAAEALVAPSGATWQTVDSKQALLEQGRALLGPKGPQLVIIQVDEAMAGLRTADRQSPAHKDALKTLDALLIQLLEPVDLKTNAVLIAGTTPEAGNLSGIEDRSIPLIMAGAGVKSGVRGEGDLSDIAPTTAALLGSPTPVQSQGRPLLAALAADGRPGDVIFQRYLEARQTFTDAMLQSLGTDDRAPVPPETAVEADDYLSALDIKIQAARWSAWKQRVPARLPYLGGALVLLLLYLVVVFRQPFGGAVVLGALSYVAFFHVIFFATGGRYSSAMAGLDSLDRNLLIGLGLRTAVAMSIAALIAGYQLSRKGFKKGRYLMSAALHLGLSTAALIALPVIGVLTWTGWTFTSGLPNPALLIAVFLAAVQVVVIGYGGAIWGLLSVFSARTSLRTWPLKEVGDPVRNADKVVRMQAIKRTTKR